MSEPASTTVDALKALANESRLRILAFAAERECAVNELAHLLGLKEPTVSHHLAVLRAAGLVRQRIAGNTHWYALDEEALQRLGRSLASQEALRATPEDPDARIVANYLTPDGRLKAFPATRKKRRATLAWLARQFDEGRRYSEAEVNALIERRHHDRETFRRELVGYGMLGRKSGMYWRRPEADWAA